MPEITTRPVEDDLDQIRFRISKKVSKDLRSIAHDWGMTVPMFVALQMNLLVRGFLQDEADRAREVSHDRG